MPSRPPRSTSLPAPAAAPRAALGGRGGICGSPGDRERLVPVRPRALSPA
jgi:hypothetical protein